MPRPARAATLFLRVTLPNGKRPYLKPVLLANKRLRPHYALRDGKAEHFPDGVYWLRHTVNQKATFTRIGPSPEQAMARQREHEAGLAATAAGLSIQTTERDAEREPSVTAGTVTVDKATKDWEVKLTSRKRTDKTIKSFLRDMEELQTVTDVKHVEDINRKVVQKYIRHLVKGGYSAKTIENRVGTVRAFMYFVEEEYDVTLPSLTKVFSKKDRPDIPEPNPEVYTEGQLKALFAGSTEDERVLWEFFLETGFREQEVMYTTWSDLELPEGRTGLARVREKIVTTPLGRKHDFQTKNRKGRVVPLSGVLVGRLLKYKERHKDGGRGPLVFGLPNGEPDGHMLRKLKECAFRLKLNCGDCVNERTQNTCTQGAWCSHWQLHAFRRTIASAWHHSENMALDKVRALLGHSNLETTRHYLARLGEVREDTSMMASSAANRFR